MKKKNVVFPDLTDIQYTSGQSWYIGADDVFYICLALSFAIQSGEEFISKHKKHASSFSPIWKKWVELFGKNVVWMQKIDDLNACPPALGASGRRENGGGDDA